MGSGRVQWEEIYCIFGLIKKLMFVPPAIFYIGAPRLKCQELLNYVVDIVKDASSCAVYGADCSSILLKDILSERKYWCEISNQQWSG